MTQENVEQWKYIEGYEPAYKISSLGRVGTYCIPHHNKFSSTMRILKPVKTKPGYFIVKLHLNKHSTTRYVHRLVAQAFHPNPENKPQVNHINAVKSDNRACNLEWATRIENQRHAIRMGLIPKPHPMLRNATCRPVIRVSLNGDMVEYPSARQASMVNNISDSYLAKICRTKSSKIVDNARWHWKENVRSSANADGGYKAGNFTR